MNRLVYDSFEEYLTDYPEIKKCRVYLTGKRIKTKNREVKILETKKVCFVKTLPYNNGFIGDYFVVETCENYVIIKDCDDCAVKIYSNNTNNIVKTIKELAPITMKDLREFFSQENIEYW